jgi:hypothetical protein
VKLRPFWLILPVVAAGHLTILWWFRDILLFHYPARESPEPVVNFFTEDVPVEPQDPGELSRLEKRFTVTTRLMERPLLTKPDSRLEDVLSLPVPPPILAGNEGKLAARSEPAVSLFHFNAVGHRVVYLIDASGSMWNREGTSTRLIRAQNEVERSISALPEDAQFNVIYFADRPVSFSGQMRYASVRAKEEVRKFLSNPPELRGETDLVDGLGEAFKQEPDNLFVLTDGIANKKVEEVVRSANYFRKKYAAGARVFAVGFGLKPKGEEADLLKRLTQPTRGDYEIYHSP